MDAKSQESRADLVEWLPADEDIIGRYGIGGFKVVTTPERVIFLKKFPATFIEVRYNEITNLEYSGAIIWNQLLKGFALLAFAAVLFLNNLHMRLTQAVTSILLRLMPEVLEILSVQLVISVAIWLSTAAGLSYIIKFVPTARGSFRVLRVDRNALVIPTGMSQELKSLIRELESLIRQKTHISATPQATLGTYDAQQQMQAAIKVELTTKLKGVKDNAVILISSKSELHTQIVSNMLDLLVNKKEMGGVYLSITKPHEFILTTMSLGGVSTKNVFFIDCISLMAGKIQHERMTNVVFVENPSSLEEVSMYLDKMLSRVQSPKKFIFLDSLSSLLIYNSDKSVKEFAHFLINKIRLENIAGVILNIEKKEAEDIVRTLRPMCDAELRF
jgi:hypothetical protein